MQNVSKKFFGLFSASNAKTCVVLNIAAVLSSFLAICMKLNPRHVAADEGQVEGETMG